MAKSFIEFFGWCGVVAILLAYCLVSFNVFSSMSLWYQILNCIGAVGIIFVSLYKRAYQLAFLNIIWAVIALIMIISLLL